MFAVLGEALLDMVQAEAGGAYTAQPGGGPLNIAVGLRRLGHETQLLARLSTGALGTSVREYAVSNGLDLSAVVETSAPTTLAFAMLDDQGTASYEFYVEGTADWAWTVDELPQLSPEVNVLHVGSLATVIEPGATAILRLVQRVFDTGGTLVSFDPNVRPALAGAHLHAVERVESFVRSSHLVKTSDDDLGWLYPGADVDDVLDRWLDLGPSLVVLTVGRDGCRAATCDGQRVSSPGEPVDVIDTIGAGDAFESGLLSALAEAGAATPESLASIDSSTVRLVLQQANRVAAMACERRGADPPTEAELTARARSRERQPDVDGGPSGG